MPASEILDRDATAQIAALTSKQVSAVELLKASLARHEQTHKTLNAVVAADLERAIERARSIDDQRAKGMPLGPLAGLPMTIKDTFDVSGMAASSGLEAFRQRKPEDAVVVAHARAAGAVIWGKTNVPVLAGDWQTFNKLYGTTNNPWDTSRTPGGSSGGAAAALAAGVTALEIGSDIGGSLRVPASHCGVFSHKPTWGLVSQLGHIPPRPGSRAERDLNVVGPMARSARDLRLLLSIIEARMTSPRAAPADLAQTRIALWVEEPAFLLDPEVRTVIEAFAAQVAAAGAQVEVITAPVDATSLLDAYAVLLGGIIGEDMPDAQYRSLDRIRWFARQAKARGAGPLSSMSLALAYTARHREWLAADAVRARLSHEIAGVLDKFDVIMAPISPVAAFPHQHKDFARRRLITTDGRKHAYVNMLDWIALATACRLPATTVPAGLTPGGLPVGVQLIGAKGNDSKTLAIAQAIDENVRGFVAPPES